MLLVGCSPPPTQGTTPTAAPASASPAPTASPTQAVDDFTLRDYVTKLQSVIDGQIKDKVLTAKLLSSEKDQKVTAYSGTMGVRRITVERPKVQGTTQYYFEEGRVTSLLGSSTVKGKKRSFWAGFAPDGHLLGPPYVMEEGTTRSFPESEVRQEEKRAMELLSKAKNS